jgi:LmbE family N-acetylglucosaminyl deacetylase
MKSKVKMSDGSDPRLLGIFAHPDDETFCAGGAFAKYVDAGAEVMVVSITQGEAGQIRDARVATRRTLGQTRARELQLACEELGVQHAVCLNFGDGKLSDIDPDILIEKAVEIIRTFRPHTVITFGNDGAYGHPDHIAVSRATTKAFSLAGDRQQFPEQFESGLKVHSPERLYHSHFPRSRLIIMNRLVKWLVGLDTRFRGTVDFAHALMLLAEESTTLRIADDHIFVQWYPAGFYIIEQGEPASKLYMILSGQVDVFEEDEDGTVRLLASRGPGEFVGELGVAYDHPRNAHVVAKDNVTCFVFSPGEPTAFAGRGEDARFAEADTVDSVFDAGATKATTCIDACAYVGRKVAALAAHRTQYPFKPDMFPLPMLEEMFGNEYFVRIHPRVEMEKDLFEFPLSIQSTFS